MKKFLSALLFLAPCIALAGAPEGDTKQAPCGFDSDGWLYTSGNLNSISMKTEASVISKMLPDKKPIAVGDSVFYAKVGIKQKRNLLQAKSDIVLKGSRFIDPNYQENAGTQFSITGTFSKDGVTYSLVELQNMGTGAYIAGAVGENGYFCSGALSIHDGGTYSRNYDVYQKEPMVRGEQVIASSEQAIAISLKSMDGAIATFNVQLLVDGRVTKQREIQADAMSGDFKIESTGERLEMKFAKASGHAISVSSVIEPSDYGRWAAGVRSRLENNFNF